MAVFGKCLVALAVLACTAAGEEAMRAAEAGAQQLEEDAQLDDVFVARSAAYPSTRSRSSRTYTGVTVGSSRPVAPGAPAAPGGAGGKSAVPPAPPAAGQSALPAFPFLDILDAAAFCGSPATISSCGFPASQPACLNTPTGQVCYTGVCVCTAAGGCMDATCANTGEPCLGPTCSDGVRCMTMPGTGWSCWHPCNPAHQPLEYGVNSGVVQSIRDSGACAAYNAKPDQQQGPLFNADQHLDGGIQLTAEAYPIFGGESQDNGGGACRRRSAPGFQEDQESDADAGAQQQGGPQQKQGEPVSASRGYWR